MFPTIKEMKKISEESIKQLKIDYERMLTEDREFIINTILTELPQYMIKHAKEYFGRDKVEFEIFNTDLIRIDKDCFLRQTDIDSVDNMFCSRNDKDSFFVRNINHEFKRFSFLDFHEDLVNVLAKLGMLGYKDIDIRFNCSRCLLSFTWKRDK